MKRITAIILAALLLMSLAACGEQQAQTEPATTAPEQQTTTTLPELPTVPTTGTQPTETEPARPVMLTVSFVFNDDSGNVTAVEFPQDGVYENLTEPTREGFAFLGWFTKPKDGVQVTDGMELVSRDDHILYARWEGKTRFDIMLDANGGRISSQDSRITLENGDKYGTLPEPMREGYKFLGWYTQAEGGQRIKSSTKFTADADQTLYAHWEYNALSYWQYVLENRVQQIPQERRVVVYLERNAGYKTYIDCPFLTDAGAINPAEGLEEYKVTDEWIESVNPYIIIKLSTDMDMALISKTGMLRRFPDADIYVFSTNAVSGSDAYQLYCRLYLAKLLYPEYFEDVDLDVVKSELKVKVTVYH